MVRYYLLALLVILLDQATKWIVVKRMELHESIPVIEGFFAITSHRNKGAAWGILQGQMTFFYIITIIVIAAIVYYMHRHAKDNSFSLVGLSLILGGAIGNFIDRIVRKEVVDFLDFTIINYHYPIFNIADSALTIGVIIVFIATLLEEKRKKRGSDFS